MSGQWYFIRDRKKCGPVYMQQLKAMARSRLLKPADMVLELGSGKWVTASSVPGLLEVSTPILPQGKPASLGSRGLLIGGGVLAGVFMLCCGGLTIVGIVGVQSKKAATRKDIGEGHELWAAGKKADGVGRYKSAVNRGTTYIEQSDRPTVFQRIIEQDVEQGNTSSAKHYIEKALNDKVALFLKNSDAQRLLAEVQADREKQVAEAKRRKEAEREKQEAEAKRRKEADQWSKAGLPPIDIDPELTPFLEFSNWKKDSHQITCRIKAKTRLDPGTGQTHPVVEFYDKDGVRIDESTMFISSTLMPGDVVEKSILSFKLDRTTRIKIRMKRLVD